MNIVMFRLRSQLKLAQVGGIGLLAAFSSSPATLLKSTKPSVTFYQYEPCPYCCKTKAVMDYLQVPYKVIEVNPVTKKELKEITDYSKVPVAVIDGEVVPNSSDIIARLQNGSGLPPVEKEWSEWVDVKLITLMPPNIYRTVPEALEAFEYCLTEGNFTAWERRLSKYTGAAAMYFISKKLKKKYGIEDERQALYGVTAAWLEAIGDKPFLGGNEPNLTDVSVFGVFRSIVGLETFNDVMQNTNLKPWFDRMSEKVGPSQRIQEA
ncbi:prostaglandin E synthase [Thraustotheca clavata]|uniref:Prostaglandin E synthase 2 n=1 Tax=Thraustotheca clavata TaxID=74557 RepID=A0A1W0AAN7_9STRA|nr:prostaglandin E synthase [Thraustotheca clavata]